MKNKNADVHLMQQLGGGGGSNDDNLSFNSEPTSDWQSLSITALKQAPAAAATAAASQIVV